MTEDFHLGEILLSYPSERDKLTAFLAANQLQCEPDLDTAIGIFDANETLVGCGCAAGSLLKCFAVSERSAGKTHSARCSRRSSKTALSAGCLTYSSSPAAKRPGSFPQAASAC